MATDAPWWDNPGASNDDAPVVRHAPDSNHYHVPDDSQLSKMRGSKVGRFAVIPAANHDGTSRGFDPTVAGPVHVDPDAPDGGVVFNPSTVRKSDVDRAVATSQYPHQALYQLGTSAPSLGIGTRKQAAVATARAEAPAVNPHMPNTYVTPSASQAPRLTEIPTYTADGFGGGPASHNPMYRAQEELVSVPPLESLPPAPALPAGPSPLQPAPYPAAYPSPGAMPPTPAYYQPPQAYQPPPPMDPNMQALMQGMVGLQQAVAVLGQQVHQQQARPQFPPTTGMSPNPLPQGRPPQLTTAPMEYSRAGAVRPSQGDFDDDSARPIRRTVRRDKETQEVREEAPEPSRSLVRQRDEQEPRQTLRDYARQDAEPEGVIVGFETLNLPFVTGPMPTKARKQVVFEIPGAGKHMARFHDVINSRSAVVLVYDTRYEEGQQYVPPELEPDAKMIIHVNTGKKRESYEVASHGLEYSFGVFDHIVLVKTSRGEVDYDRDANDA